MTSPSRDDDAFLALAFSFQSSPNAYALLIGAGVSVPSGVPSAWEVLNDVCRRMAHKLGEDHLVGDEPTEWYLGKYETKAEYGPLLSQLAPTPTHRQELLAGYFEATEEDIANGRKQPTAAHRAIAKLARAGAIRVIVTLNFDRLIETALRDENIEPLVVSTATDMHDMPALHTIPCCVIHLHGDYRNPVSMRNTEEELGDYEPQIRRRLERIFEDYGLVVAGWSATHDPALREAIRANYRGSHALVWIEPFPPSQEAQDLLSDVDGILMPTDADTAFGRLAVDVLPVPVRRAPAAQLVVNEVEDIKRELAAGRPAIGAHQRLNAALASLQAHSDFHLRGYDDDAEYGGYTTMVTRSREAASLPTTLIATVAYWGSPETDQWWLPEIRRLSLQVGRGGLTKLLQLSRVAAVQLYYAAGVSAVASRRHDLLAQLLSLSVETLYNDRPERLATMLEPELVLGQGARTFYDDLAPLLLQSLGIGEGALEEAWQLFDILRFASTLTLNPRFYELAADLDQKRDILLAAEEAHSTVGANNASAQAARNQAWQEAGRALGRLADLVPTPRVHVLAQRYARDGAVGAPAALQLADELRDQGSQHPLYVNNVFAPGVGAASAVEAVSVALGRLGNNMTIQRIPPGGGVIPQEIWIDSGETPYERQRATAPE